MFKLIIALILLVEVLTQRPPPNLPLEKCMKGDLRAAQIIHDVLSQKIDIWIQKQTEIKKNMQNHIQHTCPIHLCKVELGICLQENVRKYTEPTSSRTDRWIVFKRLCSYTIDRFLAGGLCNTTKIVGDGYDEPEGRKKRAYSYSSSLDAQSGDSIRDNSFSDESDSNNIEWRTLEETSSGERTSFGSDSDDSGADWSSLSNSAGDNRFLEKSDSNNLDWRTREESSSDDRTSFVSASDDSGPDSEKTDSNNFDWNTSEETSSGDRTSWESGSDVSGPGPVWTRLNDSASDSFLEKSESNIFDRSGWKESGSIESGSISGDSDPDSRFFSNRCGSNRLRCTGSNEFSVSDSDGYGSGRLRKRSLKYRLFKSDIDTSSSKSDESVVTSRINSDFLDMLESGLEGYSCENENTSQKKLSICARYSQVLTGLIENVENFIDESIRHLSHFQEQWINAREESDFSSICINSEGTTIRS